MKGEAGVLKNGVEPAPVQRRALEPLKRVRGEQAKSEEAGNHHRLHGQRADLEAGIHSAPAGRQRAAEQREDQDPEQERALMVSPGS